MRILITGGAGFIASHLADRLLESGMQVRALDSMEPQVHGNVDRPDYLDDRVELVRGDVRDREAVVAALDGIDAVFHLAAMVGVGQSQYQIARYTDTNVAGTGVVLDVLANEKHDVRKLVVASSMSVYGEGLYRRPSDGARVVPPPRSSEQLDEGILEMIDPETGETLEPIPTTEDKPLRCESIYALNKRDQEEYCLIFGRTYGIPVVALRLFNTYGARQSLANPYTGVAAIFISRLLADQSPLVYEDGLQSRDFVDVRDVAAACEHVLGDSRADGRVLNVGSGRRINVLELAHLLRKLTGRGGEPEVTGKIRSGDIRHCFADIGAIREIGFEPRIDLEDGLADLVAWSRDARTADHVDRAQGELNRFGLLR